MNCSWQRFCVGHATRLENGIYRGGAGGLVIARPSAEQLTIADPSPSGLSTAASPAQASEPGQY